MLTAPDQSNVGNPSPSIISSAQNSGAAQKQPTATWSGLTTAVGVGTMLVGAFHLVAPDFPGKTLASFGIALAPAGLYLASHSLDEEKAVSPFPHITDQFEPFHIKNDTPTAVWLAAGVADMTHGVSISTVSAWAHDEGALPPAVDVLQEALTSTKEVLAGERDTHGRLGIAFMVNEGWTTLDLPNHCKPDVLQNMQSPVSVSPVGADRYLPLEYLNVSDVLFCFRGKLSPEDPGHALATSPYIGIRQVGIDTYVLFDPKEGAYTCSGRQCRELFAAKNEADKRAPSHFVGFRKRS